MGGGEEEFNSLSGEGISSKVDLDSNWHSRLEKFREVENLFSVKDIGDSIRPTFTVPRIIVLGEESSGKSSTMERIAMMQFFPTDRKLCTRMPIELRLRYRSIDEIKEAYEAIDCPIHDSYVKMSIIPALNSTLPLIPEVIFPPHEATSKVKEWMDKFTKQGYFLFIFLYYLMLLLLSIRNIFAGNGSLSGILKDVLVIELNSTRKLNLDLIDLPGIVGASLVGIQFVDICHIYYMFV
jgi:hypothetical protein